MEDTCVRGATHSARLELALQGGEVMPWSFARVVPPPQADEGIGTSLQLNKTLQGATFGEQQPKGTPGKGLGSLGSHTASGPHSSRGLAAFHRGAGIRGCVWRTTTPQAAWKHSQSDLMGRIRAPAVTLTLSRCKFTFP